ncbi:MAG: ComEC/Rec2 family competence protein [Lachnobacterium sp.]|nr:ComEC/Rec2 family competence protein [Lachnobacterium sp.]
MRKRPITLLACMFLTGILWKWTGLILSLGIGLLLYFYATPWKERGIRFAVLVAGMPVMLLLGALCVEKQDAFRSVYLSVLEEGQSVRLAGKINRVEEKTNCFYYYLTDCSVEQSDHLMPCNDVLAYVSSDDYSVGQILILQGTISLFDEATNEGQFDSRAFYRSQKIDFGVWVDSVERVEGKSDRFRVWLSRVRVELGIPLSRYADDDGVLSAMLLGDKTSLDSEIRSLYQKSGIAHVLAISGLHISLLGMALYRLLRHRCGLTYLWAGIVAASFLVAYTLMTGNAVSARRATGMLIVYLVADLLGRSYDMLSALSLIVILLLWENPFLVTNSGFQFSVAAVVGIGVGQGVLVPRVGSWKVVYGRRKKQDDVVRCDAAKCDAAKCDAERIRMQNLVDWMKRRMDKCLPGMMISLSIQFFTLPLVAYYYYEIPVYAILLNIPVLALIPYVLGLAVFGSLTGQIAFLQPLSFALCRVCGWILSVYRLLCDAFLMLPGARMITGKPSDVRMVVYYCLLGVSYYVLWCGMKKKQRQMCMKGAQAEKQEWIRSWFGLGLGLVLVLLLTFLFVRGKPEFELDILDVGQGDAIYLCASDGTNFMIDGGSTDVKKVGTYRILPFLKAKAIRKVDYWFVSHTDEDHISGLVEVMESGYAVGTLVLAEAQKEDEKAHLLAELAQKNGIRVCYMKAGDVLGTRKEDVVNERNRAGTFRIECLYPTNDNDSEDVNDRCLVLYYEDENFSAFFGGDISSEVEEQLVSAGKCRQTDVLKASHHGSKYSNSDVLLHALHPRLTIASAGKKNRYGHPSPEAIARVGESGSTFYSTIDYGRIRVRFVDGEMVAEPYRKCL